MYISLHSFWSENPPTPTTNDFLASARNEKHIRSYLIVAVASIVLILVFVRKMMMMTKIDMFNNSVIKIGKWNKYRSLFPSVLMKQISFPILGLKSDSAENVCWRTMSPAVRNIPEPHPNIE